MYEELIKALRLAADKQRFGNYPTITVSVEIAYKLAAAIETLTVQLTALQAEIGSLRDKLSCAERDMSISQDCRTCGNRTPWCEDNTDSCKGYKWRGVQGEGQDGD